MSGHYEQEIFRQLEEQIAANQHKNESQRLKHMLDNDSHYSSRLPSRDQKSKYPTRTWAEENAS